jgi:hypothetical protein
VTTVVEERTQSRVSELLDVLRAAEADWRRCYARMLDVVSQLEAERTGAAAGFGTTARLLAGVLNLSKSESRTRAEHAELLASRQSLTGEVLPPLLPATAAELAAGTIGPSQVRVITAVKRFSCTMRLLARSIHTAVSVASTVLSRSNALFAVLRERLLCLLATIGGFPDGGSTRASSVEGALYPGRPSG